ncbi:MAG TPA: L-threonylcarbamoyladenylate synthase, partial [Gemmatimonadales bacterium]|nr:L-threonylcarbamoyladenylate synthase [Gemmatimonadales bacterium]
MDPFIARAVAVLGSGGVVGIPTDTVYGIGADPFDEAAVARLYAIKGREEAKAISVLAADAAQAATVALVPEAARRIAGRHWPGPLTMVLRRAAGAPPWLGDPRRDTVGVRVPDHEVALALLRAAGPLSVTSANPSGRPPASGSEEAVALLGDLVDLYLPGPAGGGEASTVVDLTGSEPRLLRGGPLP